MSLKNLALDVECIALALSEEGGYEYYNIDDDLRELAKNVSEMQADNDKLRKRVAELDELLPDNGRWFSAETVEAYVAENHKLRELLDYMTPIAWYAASERERDHMRDLGAEVNE